VLETLNKPYEPPCIYVPSLDSAKTALERHAQNFLCLHILARRNVQYHEQLEKLHAQDAQASDARPKNHLLDDSYYVRVAPLELQTPDGIVFTQPFIVLVLVPGLSVLHPIPKPLHLDAGERKVYEQLERGFARVGDGLYPLWRVHSDDANFRASESADSAVSSLIKTLAAGVDYRLSGLQKSLAREADKYRLQPKLRNVARGIAAFAWGQTEQAVG